MADNKFFSSPSVDVIEKSTKIIGNIFSKADFRIDGEVEGNITTSLRGSSGMFRFFLDIIFFSYMSNIGVLQKKTRVNQF